MKYIYIYPIITNLLFLSLCITLLVKYIINICNFLDCLEINNYYDVTSCKNIITLHNIIFIFVIILTITPSTFSLIYLSYMFYKEYNNIEEV